MRNGALTSLAILVLFSSCGDNGSPEDPGDEWTVVGTIYCDSAYGGVRGIVELVFQTGPGSYSVQYSALTPQFLEGEASYAITDIEAGSYFLYVIVDMNGTLDPDAPMPDAGDLVCSEIVEHDIHADTTIDYSGGWDTYCDYFTVYGSLIKFGVEDGTTGYVGLIPTEGGPYCFPCESGPFSGDTAVYAADSIECGYYTLNAFIDVDGNADSTAGWPDPGDWVSDPVENIFVNEDLEINIDNGDWNLQ